jgi:hypothetical protein
MSPAALFREVLHFLAAPSACNIRLLFHTFNKLEDEQRHVITCVESTARASLKSLNWTIALRRRNE